ncbi:RdgB/HAM1 family non-canonical purine NTP pyrophosphatase [Roseivirga echinicomitans]|uniref:dITP/XTP pyrophosphatase n=1 Tax=Roseivirga echinicomitans TaxID=296218 RepID=A0A150X164_9BACT|nr:RdgB/HAM1 family non-canonical purine NTP pyrophosphatase [Roseivirga echinicomitans]KYG72479.1 non-canonical purine NTP pyrophosphatase [Roseivirga echinicomitans]
MKICFATNNKNKLNEISQILGDQFELVSLEQIGCTEELAETQDTLEGNSLQKAAYVFEHYGIPVFADDTGLEVNGLNGEPGVYSAMYAGPERDSSMNMAKVLEGLKVTDDRSAKFRTVITYIENGEPIQFEGIAEGVITMEVSGKGGFGYDPIFRPKGYDKTFGELPSEIKNTISHRKRAFDKLINFLKGKEGKSV